MTSQQKMTIAQQFAEHFETEQRLEDYAIWSSENLIEMQDEVAAIDNKLQEKGRYKQAQKSAFRERKAELAYDIKYDDPRRIPSDEITAWLYDIGFIVKGSPSPVVNVRRNDFKTLMSSAVADAEGFKDIGVTPFLLDAERSKESMVVKTPDQFQVDSVARSLRYTKGHIKGQQSKRRKVSRTQEGYGEEEEGTAAILSVSNSTTNIFLTLADELDPMIASICSQKKRMDALEHNTQKDKEEFAEFVKWRQEKMEQARRDGDRD